MQRYILISLAVLCSTLTTAQVPQIERDALMALYNSTDGANWVDNTNWGSANPVSTWFGITVENIGGTDHVTEIFFYSNNLTGTIPPELENLTEMDYLVLSSNNLTGNIPPELGNCTNIKILSFEDNALTGNVPTSFSNLTSMTSFWLNGNLLSGDISTVFSSWTNLDYFSIGDANFSGNYNNFTGDIDLSNNPNLRIIYIDHNNISTLNVRNGNNTNTDNSYFNALDNPNLTCIFVDDKVYSSTNWFQVDPTATYVETQAECDAIAFTLIPDPNFEQALIDLGIDTDSTINGRVFTADIENIYVLDVSGENISDLTGIEGFATLIDLQCQGNLLQSLDISQNNQLQYLSLSDNQITNIDLSQNPLLTQLGLNDNQLTTIDVSNNTQLTGIFLENNQLSALQISNNQLLESLWIRNNQINNLNLSTNTNLTMISIVDNQIESLDLSSNSQLGLFRCNGNNLNFLSIKNGNTLSITEFDSRNNPNLLCVEVDANAEGNIPQDWEYDTGTTFLEDCALGIASNNLEDSIVLFPNPSSQTITIKSEYITLLEATITNTAGQITLNSKTLNSIDVSGLAKGLYFIQIHTDQGSLIKKFIKE